MVVKAKAEAKPVVWILQDGPASTAAKWKSRYGPTLGVDLLTNDVVLVSLYVDERKDLPDERREESWWKDL